MVTLNLSTEEINLIKSTLDFAYSQKLKILQLNKIIMSEAEMNYLLANANEYADLKDKISKNNME
jgi:hypothetical protein